MKTTWHNPPTLLIITSLSLAGLSLSLPKTALSQSPPQSSLPHPDSLIANSTDDLAEANQLYQQVEQLYNQGQYSAAIPLAERMLQLYQSVYGEDHKAIAYSLNYLGLLYSYQGRYSEAESLFLQDLEITKRLLGEEHPDVAYSLNNLAQLYQNQGRFSEAEPLYRQALEMRKRLLGEEHPDVATSLNNLALLYRNQGRYEQAEPLYLQALEMYKRLLGQDHPWVATSLNNLAQLHQNQGRFSEAEPLYRQALEMRKRLLGEEHPDVATSLNNLALLYDIQGRYTEAEPLYLQALEMYKRLLGQDHPWVATSLNNLAILYDNQGRYTEAELLYRQALEMKKHLLGEEHPDVAASLNNLAFWYQNQGRYSEAEPLYLQALEMRKRLLGQDHPDVATSLNNLAVLYANLKDIDNTLTFLEQGLNVEEYNLAYNLASGFERQKRDYLQKMSGNTNFALHFHLHSAPNNPQAVNLALTTIFRRKGRILDVSTNSLRRLRQNLTPENQALLDELSLSYSQLANLIYKTSDNQITLPPEDYRLQLESVEKRVQDLENQLSRQSEQWRIESKPVTVETIQPLIPDDAVLVELVRYEPYNPSDDSYDKPRYAAYILSSTGEPQAIDLGEADIIEEKIETLRKVFNNTQLPIPIIKQTARALDTLIMASIRERIGNKRHILIAPDSALNLIPFEALVDENNRYLVETYSFTYLTSGRDLIKLQYTASPQQSPVLIADPYFHRSDEVIAENRRYIDLAKRTFPPLPGTADEAVAIGILLQITPLTGTQATEGAVKRVKSPSILHIATHGFFETNPQSEIGQETITNNPLLLSGLVLAGFRVGDSGGEDGILTAQEVSALDLVGTKLVVLSACDTGVGTVDAGEGIYGLRRALVLAGAESQVMSLWKVSDSATKDLMVKYYQKLRENQGRSEALRQTQLEMLESGEYQHPYYWAAFIPSGDWTPMER